MKESLSGVEALENLPLNDVILPLEKGLATLTDSFKAAVEKNKKTLSKRVKVEGREWLEGLFNKLAETQGKGGYSLTERELRLVREKWGQYSFRGVLNGYIIHVFSKLLVEREDSPRHPGETCLGYVLDLLHLIDPAVASYDDGVKEVIGAFGQADRKTRCSLFTLGAMVDDGENLRGSKSMPFELFIDQDEVRRFKESFLRLATESERKEFVAGYSISWNELQYLVTGSPGN